MKNAPLLPEFMDGREVFVHLTNKIKQYLNHFCETYDRTGRRPALDPFKPGDSMLCSFLRNEHGAAPIPRIPNHDEEPKPSLLLHGLGDVAHEKRKSVRVY
jgi:hypothetical protein